LCFWLFLRSVPGGFTADFSGFNLGTASDPKYPRIYRFSQAEQVNKKHVSIVKR
jgi:hypothetical protein